uniref:Cytochrome c oxidase assembly protein COX19 n=1 Tax=Sarcoptes scabiei TaxID=52283 RepID=A0A834RA37_SARSC
MVNNIAGSKLFIPTPPIKGECKEFMRKYQECLVRSLSKSDVCKDLAKDYLNCRMEKDLMAKEDFKHLGFKVDEEKSNN